MINEETKEERFFSILKFICRQEAIRKIDTAMGNSVQTRNRRMFGNLLGHLNQARSLINKDQKLFDKQVRFCVWFDRPAKTGAGRDRARAKGVGTDSRDAASSHNGGSERVLSA